MANEELNGIHEAIVNDAIDDLACGMFQFIQKPSACRTERDELFYKINRLFFGTRAYRLSKETRDKICSINDDTSLEKLQELYARCEIEINLPYKNNERLDEMMKTLNVANRVTAAVYCYIKMHKN